MMIDVGEPMKLVSLTAIFRTGSLPGMRDSIPREIDSMTVIHSPETELFIMCVHKHREIISRGILLS